MLFQLIIIQIVTFFAIVFVLKKILYSETAKEVKRLRVLKEENFKKAKELQQKIEAAENVYRQKLTKAEAEIRKLRAKSEEEVEEIKKKRIAKAKEESERIVKGAFNAKEKIREEIIYQMNKKTPALASRIFKQVLSSQVKKITHKELVKTVIDEVKKIDKSRFKINIKKGELISAYPLEKSEKNELSSLIFEKLGYKIAFDEGEKKELVAGIIIRLENLVIDGSLENRLKQIEMKNEK